MTPMTFSQRRVRQISVSAQSRLLPMINRSVRVHRLLSTAPTQITDRLRDKSGFPNFPFSSLFLHLVLTILNTIPQFHRRCFRLCLCLTPPISVVVQSLVHSVSSLRSSCPNSLSFLITNANSFLSSTGSVISTLCHSKHIRDLPRV